MGDDEYHNPQTDPEYQRIANSRDRRRTDECSIDELANEGMDPETIGRELVWTRHPEITRNPLYLRARRPKVDYE